MGDCDPLKVCYYKDMAKKSTKLEVNILGWYGVLAILAAYILLTFHVIGSGSSWYQALNLTGALGLIVEAFSKKDFQPVALNIVWAIVAVIGLIKIFA
jgi:hypothetical protein